MVLGAIWTAFIAFLILFGVMTILVFTVKWMYVFNILETRQKHKARQKKLNKEST